MYLGASLGVSLVLRLNNFKFNTESDKVGFGKRGKWRSLFLEYTPYISDISAFISDVFVDIMICKLIHLGFPKHHYQKSTLRIFKA